MVYQKKMVAVVKCNGVILRETNDNDVFLPFGTEYSILLKNLDTRRAIVRVSIDGNDVMDGSSIIIPSNSDFELIGFLKNYNIKNKFKFIKKTSKIVEHLGDNIDDGIVRIEYGFEQYNNPITWSTSYSYYWPNGTSNILTSKAYYTSGLNDFNIKNCALGDVTYGSTMNNVTSSCNCSSIGAGETKTIRDYKAPDIKQDEGITVKGSEVNQTFNSVYFGTEVDKDCITIRIKGTNEKIKIKEPITIKYRIECETCGRKHKPNKKFCFECGTSLLIS